jgi:hypothetical protein
MRSGLAFIIMLGLATYAATLVILKGGNSMSVQHNQNETGIGLQPSNTRRSGAVETATFALG